MAFYQNNEKRTREQKRASAEARGGYDDEGRNYRGNRNERSQGRFQSDNRSGERGGYSKSRGGFDQNRGERGGYSQNRGERGGYAPKRDERGGYSQNRGERGGYAPKRDERGGYGQSRGGDRGGNFRNDAPNGASRGNGRPMQRNDRFEQVPQRVGDARYSERGRGVSPRPYHEQKKMQNGYDRFRYNAPTPITPAPAVAPIYEAPQEDVAFAENLLSGRNPIREALKSGRDIEKLLVARGELSGSAREIVQMAKERRIPVQEVDRIRLDAITRNHQGMLAFASAHQYSNIEDMLAIAKERNEDPFLVVLDGITDPHNLGAIIRSAECAGAHGVIVQERRAVGLTPAAVKASAGAVEYIPVARVVNLTSAIEKLQAEGIWVYAADMKGENYASVDFSGPVALVIGSEGEGVGKRVLDNCDKIVSIPLKGKLESLNASVAAGILLYAAMAKR